MKIQIPHKKFCSVALIALSASALHGAIYSETFDNDSGANKASSTIGWKAYVGAGAVDNTTIAPDTGNRIGISGIAGNPASDGLAYYYASNSSATQNMIWAGFEDGLSLTGVTDISWRMGNSTTQTSVKLIVQVDGSWYASATDFSNSITYTGGTFSSAGATADTVQSLIYSTDAANWLNLTIDPGNSLAIGSTAGANLSSAPITGIGFYVDSGNTFMTARLDTLVVVPEPSVSALALGSIIGFGAMFMIRRRRR